MKLTKEEQLIQFFIDKFNNSNTNEVSIAQNDVSSLNLTEQEASRYIHLLQEEKLLIIKQKSVHNNFNMYWTVKLTSNCVNYFDNKKEEKITKRRATFEEIRQWATLVLAIAGFGLSILSIVLQYIPST